MRPRGRRTVQALGLGIPSVLTAVLLALVVTGCSSPDDPVSSPTNEPSVPLQPSQPADDVPRDDLTQEHYVTWDKTEVIAARSIRVTFWAGTPRCFGSRYVVEETHDAIAIAVIEGKIPNAPNACTEEARQATLVVQTQHPIGDRNIVALSEAALKP